MKKIVATVIIGIFLLSPMSFAAQNQPLKTLGDGLKQTVTGTVDVPENMTGRKVAGTQAIDKTDVSKDAVGKGIVRVFKGAFQILTFWYPKDEQPAAKK